MCRHRTMDFVAAWKNLKKDKPCTIKFCHKCLCNRTDTEKKQKKRHFWRTEIVRSVEASATAVSAEARTPTHWYACVHSQDNWFFLCSEILHAKGPENFGIKKIVKGVDVGPTHTRRQHD
ncbi:unnamed protein product [Camellia sinensis]